MGFTAEEQSTFINEVEKLRLEKEVSALTLIQEKFSEKLKPIIQKRIDIMINQFKDDQRIYNALKGDPSFQFSSKTELDEFLKSLSNQLRNTHVIQSILSNPVNAFPEAIQNSSSTQNMLAKHGGCKTELLTEKENNQNNQVAVKTVHLKESDVPNKDLQSISSKENIENSTKFTP